MRKKYDLELSGKVQLEQYAHIFAMQVKDQSINERGPIVYSVGSSDLLPNNLEIFKSILSHDVPQATIHVFNLALGRLHEQLRLILHNIDPAVATSTLNG